MPSKANSKLQSVNQSPKTPGKSLKNKSKIVFNEDIAENARIKRETKRLKTRNEPLQIETTNNKTEENINFLMLHTEMHNTEEDEEQKQPETQHFVSAVLKNPRNNS